MQKPSVVTSDLPEKIDLEGNIGDVKKAVFSGDLTWRSVAVLTAFLAGLALSGCQEDGDSDADVSVHQNGDLAMNLDLAVPLPNPQTRTESFPMKRGLKALTRFPDGSSVEILDQEDGSVAVYVIKDNRKVKFRNPTEDLLKDILAQLDFESVQRLALIVSVRARISLAEKGHTELGGVNLMVEGFIDDCPDTRYRRILGISDRFVVGSECVWDKWQAKCPYPFVPSTPGTWAAGPLMNSERSEAALKRPPSERLLTMPGFGGVGDKVWAPNTQNWLGRQPKCRN